MKYMQNKNKYPEQGDISSNLQHFSLFNGKDTYKVANV